MSADAESVARAIARKMHGPLQDLDEVVEWGEPAYLGMAVWGQAVSRAKPSRAPLWALYLPHAEAALQAISS